MPKQHKTSAIIVAAGSSRRMNGTDKIFADLAGRPVLAQTIAVFEECREIAEVVVVVRRGSVARCKEMVAGYGFAKVSRVCAGGRRRQDSVKAGLDKLKKCDWVVVHDGARPLVTDRLIRQGLKAARETGAAVAAVPVSDTIKIAGEGNIIRETVDRSNLRAVQTPQVFRYGLLKQAYAQPSPDATDDATLVEGLGYRVKLYTGAYDNIKITSPADLVLAEVLLEKHGE